MSSQGSKATRSSLPKMFTWVVEMRRTLYQNIMEDSRNEVGQFSVMLLKCHTKKQALLLEIIAWLVKYYYISHNR